MMLTNHSPAITPPLYKFQSMMCSFLCTHRSSLFKPTTSSPYLLSKKPLPCPRFVSLMASLRSAIASESVNGTANRSGEVHVIVGPMFAGKTTALLRRIKLEDDNGRSVAMIKSSKDTRYAVDSVVTHDGVRFPCWAMPDLTSFRHKFGVDAYDELDVIGIDEAQFFGDLYDFCCTAADKDGKIIIVAGLDGDFLSVLVNTTCRRSFGSVLDIIPLADTVTKLTARCELCGKRAFFTLRKTEETQTELVAGSDVYMPVCRQHYVNAHSVIKAARDILKSHKIHNDNYLDASSTF
ncbi:hypothetical protein QQ045_006122 [Rhodiola kirilowii]